METLVLVLGCILGVPAACLLLLLVYLHCRGAAIRKAGEKPFDARQCEAAGYRYVEVETVDSWTKETRTRQVAYLVFGSQKPDAKVCVYCHGSGQDSGSAKCYMPEEHLLELNVKMIAPDLPGHGFTSMHKARQIGNWPREDLEAILAKENVGQFVVHGHSFGTAHALACGVHFGPERCVGVGVNGPFLDITLCDEIAAATKKKFRCDARSIPSTAYLESCRGSWMLAVLCFALGWVKNQEWSMASLPDFKPVVQRRKRGEKGGEVLALFMEGNKTTSRRGAIGQAYDDANREVAGLWGFDPRKLRCRALSIWWAEDDTQSPPEHGAWLVQHFEQRAKDAPGDFRLDVKREKMGFGHFTYLQEEFRATCLQTKILWEMATQDETKKLK